MDNGVHNLKAGCGSFLSGQSLSKAVDRVGMNAIQCSPAFSRALLDIRVSERCKYRIEKKIYTHLALICEEMALVHLHRNARLKERQQPQALDIVTS